MKFKKASLALSVNAIVVVVIAFVVLGLALTLTRTIFKGASEQIPGALQLTALQAQPTSDNPITLSDTLHLKAKGKLEVDVGYYNKGPNPVSAGKFKITGCESEDSTNAPVVATTLPTAISRSEAVPVAESKAYKLIIKENGLTAGYTYICTFGVMDGAATVPSESKSVFVKVYS